LFIGILNKIQGTRYKVQDTGFGNKDKYNADKEKEGVTMKEVCRRWRRDQV